MQLEHFYRDNPQEPPEARLQALMRAIVIRPQFLPALRFALGWRGLKQSAAGVEGWSARVQGCAGVFGLYFTDAEIVDEWLVGGFGLCYFPDPQEPLVEKYSVRAAACAQRQDYMARIREFLVHPELVDLFGVGRVLLALRREPSALILAVESLSAQRTIAADGILLHREGNPVQLVPPGGRDQDLPAFAAALPFFEVLAASLSFDLERYPDLLVERRFAAGQQIYDAAGQSRTVPTADVWRGVLVLGYGEADGTRLPGRLWPEGAMLAEARANHPERAPAEYRDRRWWRIHAVQEGYSLDKKILGVDDRPPLILLTGFLGAGKTSFLQHFIEYQTQRSRFVAVIQNEIGAVGLDGKLLDYTVTEIDEGCVCCGLSGNLQAALADILDRFSPDYIILETSGLANPLNLLSEMPALEARVRFDCTVTVVDALNFDAAAAHYAIASDQIRAADVLILNKCDLVEDARRQQLHRHLSALKPEAPVIEAVGGYMNTGLILDGAEGCGPAVPAKARPDSFHPTHAHDGLRAGSLIFRRRLERARLVQALQAAPAGVFRIKGIVDLSDPPQTVLVQYVAGRYDLSDLPHPRTAERFLTVIGQENDVDGFPDLERMLRAAHTAD